MLKSQTDFLESTRDVTLVTNGKFALENEPIAWQIQIHLSNMQHTREQMNVYSMATILDYAMDLLANSNPELWIENKSGVHFRLAQLIQYYGKAELADYIKLVYSREVGK